MTYTHYAKENVKNAALFLRLGLPSTLIRHGKSNGASKRSSNRGKLKSPALCFSVDEKRFENGAFRK